MIACFFCYLLMVVIVHRFFPSSSGGIRVVLKLLVSSPRFFHCGDICGECVTQFSQVAIITRHPGGCLSRRLFRFFSSWCKHTRWWESRVCTLIPAYQIVLLGLDRSLMVLNTCNCVLIFAGRGWWGPDIGCEGNPLDTILLPLEDFLGPPSWWCSNLARTNRSDNWRLVVWACRRKLKMLPKRKRRSQRSL